jgi:nucleotide-binding universal stress UspA family protein
MTVKKILVAHDFSTPSNRALSFAADLSKQIGAELEIMHVHPDVYDGHSDPALGLPWPTSAQEERYLRFLDTELERIALTVLGAPDDTAASRHVVRGDPVKRIVQHAQDVKADVICLGSTGKGAVERVLLGSVSQSVVRASPIPVITVH